ncbi:MAG: hypothetical protein LBT00_05345 [Spirochaetaceae bacterium]|nr:hypothetical protein [Spirochaetaceae bacterium]
MRGTALGPPFGGERATRHCERPARHCERSEAIQGLSRLDCFGLRPRNAPGSQRKPPSRGVFEQALREQRRGTTTPQSTPPLDNGK